MDSTRLLVITSAAAVMALAIPAAAQQATAEMHAVSAEGIGEQVGTIQLADSAEGLVIQTDLSDLAPGAHGLHLHSEGSCEPAQNDQGQMAAAMAAKGHYDPDDTGKHAGPEGDGHKGDLPVLEVGGRRHGPDYPYGAPPQSGGCPGARADDPCGGDNYSDEPKPLGGGGARIACGVIE